MYRDAQVMQKMESIKHQEGMPLKMENPLKNIEDATAAEKSCYNSVYCAHICASILFLPFLCQYAYTLEPYHVMIIHFYGKIIEVLREPGPGFFFAPG
jgi:hypothetical protein